MKAKDLRNQLCINPESSARIKQFQAQKKLEEIMSSFQNCACCGNKLFFHHEAEKEAGSIVEHILCPHCQKRAPERSYLIN